MKRDTPQLNVICGRDRNGHVNKDPMVALMKLRFVRSIRRPSLLRRREPGVATLLVANIEPDAVTLAGRVGLVPREGESLPAETPATAIGNDGRKTAIAEHERL